MACPQISLWSPAPSRCLSPMHSIDIATLSDHLQRLTPSSDIISDFTPSPDLFVSYSRGVAHFEPKVIDTFTPRRDMSELSPTSSMSSSDASDSSLTFSPEDAFFATRSRVVRVSGVRPRVALLLTRYSYIICQRWRSLFCLRCFSRTMYAFLPFYRACLQFEMVTIQTATPNPVTMWELADEFAAGRRDSVWAVFRTHEEVSLKSKKNKLMSRERSK